MGLPNVREQLPNGPGSIVPSATILLMEDCIIGQKFKSTPLMAPGGLFRVNGGGTTATLSGTVWTVNTTAGVELVCDLLTLSLMPGTRLASLAWSGNVVSLTTSNAQLQFRLRKRSFGDNGTTTGIPINDSLIVSGAGIVLHESVTTPYVTETNMMYQLSITFPSGNYTFDGARLLLDRL